MSSNPTNQRCSVTLANGRPCPNWAVKNSGNDHPLCRSHPNGRPQVKKPRRCTAIKKNGAQCRQWAVRDSQPPRCPAHGGTERVNHIPLPPPKKRCQVISADGTQCRRWQKTDGGGMCAMHNREFRLNWKSRCTAKNLDGKRCTHWGTKKSKMKYGRWLCNFHLPEGDPSKPKNRFPGDGERRCQGKTAAGEQCRQWALSEGPPLCWLHAHPGDHPNITHGLYRTHPPFSLQEKSAIKELLIAGKFADAEYLLNRLQINALIKNLPDTSANTSYNYLLLIIRRVKAQGRLAKTVQKTDPPDFLLHYLNQRPSSSDSTYFETPIYLDDIPGLTLPATRKFLDDEINVTRVALRHIFGKLQPGLGVKKVIQVAQLILNGVNTLSRLVMIQHRMNKKRSNSIEEAIMQSIDLLGDQLDLNS